MTLPRRHLEGQVTMLTRRCSDRKNFLRPDAFINSVVAYEFARASSRSGVDVHAAMVMSNHPHLVVTDHKAARSDFMRDSMSGIARSRNRDLDRSGHFWDAKSYSDVVLLDRQALEEKLLYTWLNPVKAGLVDRVEDWPGFMILPKHWGKPTKIYRPQSFYSRRVPEFIEFTPQRPPGYEHLNDEELLGYFENLIRKGEETLRRERKRSGKRVKGLAKIRKVNPLSSPSTPAPRGELSPRFASKDADLRKQAIAAYRDFVKDYQAKREHWALGRKVTFPCGTLWLRRNARVICDSIPDDEPGLAKNFKRA